MCRPDDYPPYDDRYERRALLGRMLATGMVDDEVAVIGTLMAAEDLAGYMAVTTSADRIAIGLQAAPLTRAAGYENPITMAEVHVLERIMADLTPNQPTQWAIEVLEQAGMEDDR